MAGLRIDLRKLLPNRGADAAGRIARLAGNVTTTVEHASDRVLAPHADGRVRRCTAPAPARLVALADDRRTAASEAGGQGFEVAFLRLAVARPEGEAEACVRQFVPAALRGTLRLGDDLVALTDPDDPAIAIVDWEATGSARGEPVSWVLTSMQFAWPDRDQWPAPGTVAVRDGGRHERRLAKRRAEGTEAWARLLEASSRGGLTDKREDWKLALDLDGRRVELRERMPWLAAGRLIERVEHQGRMISRIERRARAGTPVAVLAGPGEQVTVDWERTLTALFSQ
jgi:hypothetical protein